MRTLLEILRVSETFLAGKGVAGARRDIELLMAATLGCKRLDLYLQFERPLPEETLAPLRDLLRRRAAREPVQYITGGTQFFGLPVKCDPRALIPRPETEELVEQVLTEIAKTAPPAATETDATAAPAVRVADLGTGTGAIALALASKLPRAEILATDASADALALARENAAALHLDERVRFALGDWFDALPPTPTPATEAPVAEAPATLFDAIVSNPPYLTAEELASAEPEVAAHEPRLALDGGTGGLDALRKILAGAREHLRAGGFLALETGIAHGALLAAEAAALGYARYEARPDLSRRQRFFFAWA
ncbi:MAG: peptide chain release factor N(5)-glutamine methyltransferase [Puniceicoccales bacterium]|jgi:release factor glutamine methyltransferase|nr:peptide chain release factor N(5)-glutamine methyltransferase [Puniceicoccales bacterium]